MKSISSRLRSLLITLAFPLALSPLANAQAEVPKKPIAKKGELLFSDDFSKGAVGTAKSEDTWKAIIPTFAIKDGVLIGSQTRDDHGSVGRVYVPMKDVVVEFRFRFDGSKTFNAVFDDKQHKGSHAGHIARVKFAPTAIRLGDDKEGVMRNDIFEMRKDPAKKAEADQLLEGRNSSTRITLEQNRWYSVRIELIGDEMRVSLDDKPVAYLKSPGLAHPTKTSLHFTVTGQDTKFDDVNIWTAEPSAE